MKSSQVHTSLCLAAAVLWFHAGPARAAIEVHGPDIEGPFSGTTSGSFNLPQFDTFGGDFTLTKVTVDVTLDTFGGKFEFDNQSPTAGPVTLAIGSSVRIKGPLPGAGSQIIIIPQAVTTFSTTLTATTGDIPADFAGPDYAFVDGPSSLAPISDERSDFRTSAVDLAPYIGTGNVTFAWDLAGNSTAGSDMSAFGGGTTRTTNTTYSFFTTVTYEFVPEPASLVLLGLGGLILLSRRRR